MTPEQLAALREELERFLTHPLNVKHRLVGQSEYNNAVFYMPLPNNPDCEFSDVAYPKDFEYEKELPRVYAFRAVLLQRLKDVLAAEGFEEFMSHIGKKSRGWVSTWTKAFEVEQNNDPEVLRLLRAINQSDIWQREKYDAVLKRVPDGPPEPGDEL